MNILVPMDFSKEAENAKEFASAVAKLTEGKIIFLYAAPPVYNFASVAEESAIAVVRRAKGLMRKYVKELESQGIRGSYSTVEDNLGSAIESMLILDEIDIIVMGTKGATGIKKVLMGSNASEIFKETAIPVLLVPFESSYNKLEKIVITMEYAEAAPKYIGEILKLTKEWGLPYEILHFNSADSDELDDFKVQHIKVLEETYPGTSFGLTSRFSSTVQEGLKQFQDEHPEAMLVMLSSHKTLLEKFFSKSDTAQMVYHPDLPLLVIKEDFIN
ncbi:universal stress protein [Algoriphagus sp. D3-2-R+10]|uniref:universal stress protein n=1 Tax=Algoriphagus aurantiacus TaxID=3103948 RepID=UPI002B3DAD2A|nr:universal stress protein [Algoriphagus sp. D3-2-R+10]MEB2777426.1 universal stress protein [Algoriphagus sp. D3-2-R+10]